MVPMKGLQSDWHAVNTTELQAALASWSKAGLLSPAPWSCETLAEEAKKGVLFKTDPVTQWHFQA